MEAQHVQQGGGYWAPLMSEGESWEKEGGLANFLHTFPGKIKTMLPIHREGGGSTKTPESDFWRVPN